jgi:hypothetical protein
MPGSRRHGCLTRAGSTKPQVSDQTLTCGFVLHMGPRDDSGLLVGLTGRATHPFV